MNQKSESELLERFQWLTGQFKGIEIKGAKSKYTSMNGNMFSFLAENTLAVRLSKEQREKFLAQHPDCVCIQYNTVMKDYVLVPRDILNDSRKLKSFYKQCVENAMSLKAKQTTRKTKKKSVAKKKAAKKHK